MSPRVTIDKRAIADLCHRHHIRHLALFGSVLGEDFSADSDVDLLVEFEPGRSVGFAIFDVEADHSRLLGGRRIDQTGRPRDLQSDALGRPPLERDVETRDSSAIREAQAASLHRAPGID